MYICKYQTNINMGQTKRDISGIREQQEHDSIFEDTDNSDTHIHPLFENILDTFMPAQTFLTKNPIENETEYI